MHTVVSHKGNWLTILTPLHMNTGMDKRMAAMLESKFLSVGVEAMIK